ncbi:MAG: short-chain dehydrogenase, partial [Actinomycetospora chiangmaiensis]|nr:short-chain dehydrogenase [Actinomycetospora chiangmaiensis]
ILHAAVHPQRDIFVGGAGKAFTAGKEFAPGAYDYLAPAIVALQKRASAPRNPDGALHAPVPAGETRGDPPVPVMRTSAYTRASLHPLTAAAGLLGVGAATAFAVLGPAAGRKRRR